MASNNSRDVSLRILVDTIGQENVDKLRTALDQLGKQGETSAAEAKALVDQLDRLGAQNDAVKGIQQLASELDTLQANEASLAGALAKNAAALVEQKDAVSQAKDKQKEATTALADAQKAVIGVTGEMKALNTEFRGAARDSETYQERIKGIIASEESLRSAVVDARVALREANNELSTAAAGQAKLETAQTRAAAAAQAAADAVTQQSRALQTAQAEADALGVSTTSLAAAEAKLQAELQGLVATAQRRATAVGDMAEADRLLAIQEASLVTLMERGATALQAEELAQRDAARAVQEYTAAKAKATADAADWQREAEAIVNAAHAAQQLEKETIDLVNANRELAAQRAFEQQANDAQKLVQAASYVRLWETELEKADAKVSDTAQGVTNAVNTINNAFSTVGTRSVQALQVEIDEVRAAMVTLQTVSQSTGQKLSGAFSTGEAKIKDLEREIRELNGTLTLADKAAGLFKNSLGQIAAGNIIADAVGYLVNKVKELGREFVTANVQAETMTRGLTAIYSSSQIAGQQMTFLRTTAQQAGISVADIADSFVRFSAATKSSNIPLSVTNDLFTAVTRAGATLGLSGERVTLVLDALGQMASKGVVSMEELRQQLGDSLPGALSRAAQGLGITDQQLIKLVESGKLATSDFFPALTKGLQDLQGENDTLAGSFGRFTGALNTAAVSAGDAGWLDLLKAGMAALNGVIGGVVVALQVVSSEFLAIGRAAGAFIGTLAGGGGLKEAMTAVGEQFDRAGKNIENTSGAFFGSAKAADANTLAVQQLGAAHATTTQQLVQATLAQERSAGATTASAQSFIAQLVEVEKLTAGTKLAVESSNDLAKAKQDEGKSLVATAQLSGDAARLLEAQAAAAQANLIASQAQVAARQLEIDANIKYIALLEGERDSTGKLDTGRQVLYDNAIKLLKQQDDASEKSRQAAAELEAQAAAARAAADAYGDNSTKIEAYRQAVENTRQTALLARKAFEDEAAVFEVIKAAFEKGAISAAQYEAARKQLNIASDASTTANLKAAESENKLRDSINDSVAAIQRKGQAQAAALQVDLASLNVAKSHYEALAKEAEALGNTTLATSYRIDAKQKEIQAVQLSTKIKLLELDADKSAIEVQIAALDPQDKLYAKKKEELDIRLQVIKAKQIEAGASADVIKGLQNEITQMTSQLSSRTSNTNSINNDTSARYKNVDSINAQTAAMAKQKTTSDGFAANKDGSAAGSFNNRIVVDKAFDVAQNGGAGKDQAYLQEAYNQAKAASAYLDAVSIHSAGAVSFAAKQSTDAILRATKAALENSSANFGSQKSNGGFYQPDGVNTSHTVTINTAGGSSTINAASAADASNLAGVLKSLGNSASTAA